MTRRDQLIVSYLTMIGLFLAIPCTIYRYKHPEKTMTQLEIDFFTLKIFKEFWK